MFSIFILLLLLSSSCLFASELPTPGVGECILGQSPDGSCNFGGGLSLTADEVLEDAVPIPHFFDYNNRRKRKNNPDEGTGLKYIYDTSDPEEVTTAVQPMPMITKELTLTIQTTVKGPKEVLTIERLSVITVNNEIERIVPTTFRSIATVQLTSTAIKMVTQEYTRTTMMMTTFTTLSKITETQYQTLYATITEAGKVEKRQKKEEEEPLLMPPIEAMKEHNGYFGSRRQPPAPLMPPVEKYNAPVYHPYPPPMAPNVNTVLIERTRLMTVTDTSPVTFVETSIVPIVVTEKIQETETKFQKLQYRDIENSAVPLKLFNVNVVLSIALAVALAY